MEQKQAYCLTFDRCLSQINIPYAAGYSDRFNDCSSHQSDFEAFFPNTVEACAPASVFLTLGAAVEAKERIRHLLAQTVAGGWVGLRA